MTDPTNTESGFLAGIVAAEGVARIPGGQAPFEARLKRIVREIELPENFSVKLARDTETPEPWARFYFQIECWRMDVITKEMGFGYGGKAYLSPHMTDLELVNCVFGLYKGYVEHEARETFLYRGYRIYGPHNALPGLVEAAKHVDVRSAKHVEDQPKG